jgi:alkanesulfonate monooxygenase
MKAKHSDLSIDLYTTSPATLAPGATPRPGFHSEKGGAYLQRVIDTARWSEECGFKGMLVYIDNSLVDNWALAQVVIEHTKRLVPLIATQPIYMHPYWAAKKIATIAHLYGRRIALNMLAGAFKGDLASLGDDTPHDQRYDRMVEYTKAVQVLLDGSGKPVSFLGRYYRLENVKMSPALDDPSLSPLVLMSGSSDAGMSAARALHAIAVRYPKPVDHYEKEPLDPDIAFGVRMGIIAREEEEDAWEVACARFQEDRKGQLTHQLAMKSSDSHWHQQLSGLRHEELTEAYPYWLTPFQNYKTFCPYLVGTYRRISGIVARYVQAGFRTFITDIPADKEELLHQKIVFELALKQATLETQAAGR